MAFLNQSQKDAAGLLTLGIPVAKAAATLPASTTQDLFVIAGGRVFVTLLLGEVTTAVQAQACNLDVVFDATAGGDITLASSLDINADALGLVYFVEGDGSALVSSGGGALRGLAGGGFIVSEGEIHILTSATNTGATAWSLWYFPLDDGASVVSA